MPRDEQHIESFLLYSVSVLCLHGNRENELASQASKEELLQ